MAAENCFMIPKAKGSPIDPAGKNGIVSKIGIDATKALDSKRSVIEYESSIEKIDIEKLFGKDTLL